LLVDTRPVFRLNRDFGKGLLQHAQHNLSDRAWRRPSKLTDGLRDFDCFLFTENTVRFLHAASHNVNAVLLGERFHVHLLPELCHLFANQTGNVFVRIVLYGQLSQRKCDIGDCIFDDVNLSTDAKLHTLLIRLYTRYVRIRLELNTTQGITSIRNTVDRVEYLRLIEYHFILQRRWSKGLDHV